MLAQKFDIVATTLPGLEPLLRRELLHEGLFIAREGVRSFTVIGNKEILYRLNMKSRYALRFLVPVLSFRASHPDELYKKVRRFEWEKFFGTDDTFAIDSVVNSDIFRNSQFITYRCKDGIVDRFARDFGKRPDVDTENPVCRIHLHIRDEFVNISLDSSGSSLHLRGYREQNHPAPLNEVLAAGLVAMSGYTGHEPLVDGMCGSGTLAIEAAMMASQTAPGLVRKHYGFMSWSDFDRKLYSGILGDLKNSVRPPTHPIKAIDRNGAFVRMAQNHAAAAGVSDFIQFERNDFLRFEPGTPEGILLLNPPYGNRLDDNTEELYAAIGTRLKHHYAGWKAWIISANPEAMHQIGLKPMKKHKLKNGALDCEYRGYELFAGKRADKVRSNTQ